MTVLSIQTRICAKKLRDFRSDRPGNFLLLPSGWCSRNLSQPCKLVELTKLKRSTGISGIYLRRNFKRAESKALPRFLALSTNSKKPKYSDSFSGEIPRCGLSQERTNSLLIERSSQGNFPFQSRQAEVYTAVGLAAGDLVHVTYCLVGIGVIIPLLSLSGLNK